MAYVHLNADDPSLVKKSGAGDQFTSGVDFRATFLEGLLQESVALLSSCAGSSSHAGPSSGGDTGGSANEFVSFAGSGITFSNTYSGTLSASYKSCILQAEQFIAQNWHNNVNLNLTFQAQNAGNTGFLATNTFYTFSYTYSQLRSAIASHATNTYAQSALATLGITDPTGTHSYSIPESYARMLGLTSSSRSDEDTVILNTSYSWSYGQDVVQTLLHEISEGAMGRIGGLGDQNSTWSTMDLFRWSSSGVRDVQDGRDGVATYFSVDGQTMELEYNNQYNFAYHSNTGDTADFNVFDTFGYGNPPAAQPFSQTDYKVLDVLGWDPANPVKVDYFIASESATGDYFHGYVYDSQAKYTTGSGFTVSTSDNLGGKWTYYVYQTAAADNSIQASQNGYVYDTSYYDADLQNTLTPIYQVGGTNFLGTDVNYVSVNGVYEKFGSTYVPNDVKVDYFIASESKSGDYYYGYIVDGTNKYTKGSGFSGPTDMMGWHWDYYVYQTASTPQLNLSQDGYVYDTSYYDADLGMNLSPYYSIGGTNSLGSDVNYISVNGTLQKFGGTNVPLDMKIDYFIASESKTGDYYFGYIFDGQSKYTSGSGFVSTTTDQAGGKWSYYVYNVVSTPQANPALNGYVYHTSYWDADFSTSYAPYYSLAGADFLGTDQNWFTQNGVLQHYGDSYYVAGASSGHTSGSGHQFAHLSDDVNPNRITATGTDFLTLPFASPINSQRIV